MTPSTLFISILLFLFTSLRPATADSAQAQITSFPLSIQIIADDQTNHPRGLSRDVAILKEALESLGHQVTYTPLKKKTKQASSHSKTSPHLYAANLFIEKYDERLFNEARYNLFIPNPEFCYFPLSALKRFDLLLARTRESERIFSAKGLKIFFLGFTSFDREMPVEKNYHQALHVKGFNPLKGTQAVFKAWKKYPGFPSLTLIDWVGGKEYEKLPPHVILCDKMIGEETFKTLQNRAGIHVAPSETEGFGHTIHEALSVGAVVVTTDAPPMNEWIQEPLCLISFSKKYRKHQATCYKVSEKNLAKKLKKLFALSEEELALIGQKNKKAFETSRENFYRNLTFLILHLDVLCDYTEINLTRIK